MAVYQVSPTKWTNRPPSEQQKKSGLSGPYIISDEMPATEQVNGVWYTSKRQYRAAGRRLGLTEVGDQNLNRKPKAYTPLSREACRDIVERSIAQWRAGWRPR